MARRDGRQQRGAAASGHRGPHRAVGCSHPGPCGCGCCLRSAFAQCKYEPKQEAGRSVPTPPSLLSYPPAMGYFGKAAM